MARIKVQGTKEFVAAVRRMGDAMLAGIAPALAEEAAETLAASVPMVPFDTGALMASGFHSPAVHRPSKHSVSATAGYEHPFAGPIHEGVHGAIQKEPPRFLAVAAKQARGRFRKRLLQAARSTLATLKR